MSDSKRFTMRLQHHPLLTNQQANQVKSHLKKQFPDAEVAIGLIPKRRGEYGIALRPSISTSVATINDMEDEIVHFARVKLGVNFDKSNIDVKKIEGIEMQ